MEASTKRKLVWTFIAVLGVVHYDFWFWSDDSLVFGFMPIGLFYQALISLFAGVAWALVVKHAWPTWVEEWASASDQSLRQSDGQSEDERQGAE